MHRPEKPQPRLTGRTVATTQRRPNGISVTTTEHFVVDTGTAPEQVETLVAWLDRIAKRVSGLSDNIGEAVNQ